MLGPTLALLASITFALKQIFIRRASLKVIDAGFGTFVSIPTGLITLLLILIVNGQIRLIFSLPLASYIWFAIAGVLHFVVGLSLYYKCVQLMGANLAMVFTRINILVSVAIGILFLNEPVSLNLLIGVALIFFGVSLPGLNTPMIRNSCGSLLKIPFKAYILAFISGFVFGVSPIFIKLGIRETGYPIVGAFISFLAGTIAMGFLLLKRENRLSTFQIDIKSSILFSLSGIIFCIGNLFRFYALKMTSASIAVPLISTMPVLVIFFSFLFNRKVEIFNRAVVIGAVSVVLGTILIF
jgi:drug/metabolite transporter (DMT)-like permease